MFIYRAYKYHMCVWCIDSLMKRERRERAHDVKGNSCAASKTGRERPGRLPRRAAGPKAAHTWYMSVTAAVFHAPMFALNLVAWTNACGAEAARGPRATERARTFAARIRGRPQTHADLGTPVAHARIGDRFSM